MVNVELGEFLLWFQDGRKGSVDKGKDGKKLKLSDVLLIVPVPGAKVTQKGRNNVGTMLPSLCCCPLSIHHDGTSF